MKERKDMDNGIKGIKEGTIQVQYLIPRTKSWRELKTDGRVRRSGNLNYYI
jgi:hypothetical protein